MKKYFQNNQTSFDLYACDYSSEVIKFLQGKNIHCTHGGADSLIPIGKADIIILSHVFEHFTNIEENLNIISQLAGNETLIYVEVPGVKNLSNNLHYNYDYQDFSVVAHIHNFTLTTLSNIFLTKQLYLLDGNEFIRSVFTKKYRENK